MPLAAQVAAIIDMAPGTATHTGSSVKLTYDGFVHFPDGGKRHVLIDGEHYVTPSPNTAHQAVSGNLHSLIRTWLEMHRVGRVFYAPFDVGEPVLLDTTNEWAAQTLTGLNVQ